jgi:hypothetical protein
MLVRVSSSWISVSGPEQLAAWARDLAPFVVAAAIVLVPYFVLERRHRDVWARVPLAPRQVASGPYRGSSAVVGHQRRAPRLVRAAALSCFLMGPMFLPGLGLGLVGLFVYGVGLVSIPGLVIAARVWMAGAHLLSGTPERLVLAREAARWSVVWNSLLAVPCALAAAWWGSTLLYDGEAASRDATVFFVLASLTLAYVAVSLAQAALVARATRDVVEPAVRERAPVVPEWLRRLVDRRRSRLEALTAS